MRARSDDDIADEVLGDIDEDEVLDEEFDEMPDGKKIAAASKADAKAAVDGLMDSLRDNANVQTAFNIVIEYFAGKDDKWEEFNSAHTAMMQAYRTFEDKLYKVYGLIIS